MTRWKGNLLLLITAIIWGTSFVTQKLGMNFIEPFTFGASRFLLGAVVLLPVIWFFDAAARKKGETSPSEAAKLRFDNKHLLLGGALCGGALFLGASFQQWGIVSTTAGKAGFITALYIVLVPLFGLFMKRRVALFTWIGVGIAVAGLYLLCITEGFSIQKGDAIVLAGTVFWALQIIAVDAYVDKVDGLKLSFAQFVVAGVLSAIAALLFEKPELANILACAKLILYTAIMVVGVAYTLQIIGQKYTNPTVAAIIMSLESVFAVISGAFFLGETMSTREFMGCVLMFFALVVTQLKPQELYGMLQKLKGIKQDTGVE